MVSAKTHYEGMLIPRFYHCEIALNSYIIQTNIWINNTTHYPLYTKKGTASYDDCDYQKQRLLLLVLTRTLIKLIIIKLEGKVTNQNITAQTSAVLIHIILKPSGLQHTHLYPH